MSDRNPFWGRFSRKRNAKELKKAYHILLLTNSDSDNLGDQVIEACDVALLSVVMKNLGLKEDEFQIHSRAASIVSKRYLETREKKYLRLAKEEIQACDLIVFGGAPMFNYLYQTFFERTAITLKLAKRYKKPVIFSAIGVEGYDEDNEKCQRLKETLNYDVVKQITTRDDFEKLLKYRKNPDIKMMKVADPAVFSNEVFFPYKCKKEPISASEEGKKTIGLFILRANGFSDNNIDFSSAQAAIFWLDMIDEITLRGYDYELLTSGHFGDEAFIDYLTRFRKVKRRKCVFYLDSPEKLISKISSYDGIVSTRLHPSIISYALQVPAVGLVWNQKVAQFYENIGYPERGIQVQEIQAKKVMDILERAMLEGVAKNRDYQYTVYTSLFSGIKTALFPDNASTVYPFEKLVKMIPIYPETSEQDMELKRVRKARRTYGKYNELAEKVHGLGCSPKILFYTKAEDGENIQCNYCYEKGEEVVFPSGAHEYRSPELEYRFEQMTIPKVQYVRENHSFEGWKLRIRIKNTWLWYMKSGYFANVGKGDMQGFEDEKRIFKDEDILPVIENRDLEVLVFEACWDSTEATCL